MHYRRSSNYEESICGDTNGRYYTTHTNVTCMFCAKMLLDMKKAEVKFLEDKITELRGTFLKTHVFGEYDSPKRNY